MPTERPVCCDRASKAASSWPAAISTETGRAWAGAAMLLTLASASEMYALLVHGCPDRQQCLDFSDKLRTISDIQNA